MSICYSAEFEEEAPGRDGDTFSFAHLVDPVCDTVPFERGAVVNLHAE